MVKHLVNMSLHVNSRSQPHYHVAMPWHLPGTYGSHVALRSTGNGQAANPSSDDALMYTIAGPISSIVGGAGAGGTGLQVDGKDAAQIQDYCRTAGLLNRMSRPEQDHQEEL